jgi:hypothetical protein
MSRVFVSETTGAVIYVHSNDHCSPHVHALHRGEGWLTRAGFSYVDSGVELKSVGPPDKPPLRRVVNGVLGDIQAHLADCRRIWWNVHQTTGLENRWAVVVAPGMIELLPAPRPGAKQIAGARYDPATGRLEVVFGDRSRVEIRLQP